MINRNNYEEYLLMYLDGELSPSERESVEIFLDANPDLKQELALLQQAILQPEAGILFTGKQSLYRKEEGISLSNYQEFFMLYIDKELSTSEKEAVETFVLQQPQLQNEFTLLKQTVLPAENIIFTNKESLYRKEEKRRPVVISLRWASLAAAMLTGIVLLVMFKNDNGSKAFNNDVATNKTQQPATTNTAGTTGNPSSTSTGAKEVLAFTEQNISGTNNNVAGLNNSNGNKTNTQPLNVQVKNNTAPQNEIAVNRPQEQRNTVVPVIENPVTNNFGNPPVTNATGDNNDKGVVATSTPAASGNNSNNNVQHAVYTDNGEADKDKTVYVGAMQVNPDKVRGFFRKATRFLSSKVKSNDDDDSKGKVKVANLEMNKIK